MGKSILKSLVVLTFIFVSCSQEEGEPLIAPEGLAYTPTELTVFSNEEAVSAKPVIQGTQPMTFSLSGNTISQISIDNEGQIKVASGATPGIYRPTITVVNKAGSRVFTNIKTIKINPALILPNAFSYSAPSAEIAQGTAFSSSAPQSNGSGPVTYSLTVSPAAGNNITITAEGVIQAGASLAAGTYVISVQVTNANGSISFNSVLTLTVKAAAVTTVSFNADIKPILNGTCTGCHSNYSDYNSVKTDVDKILNRIQRQPGSTGFMPQGGQALSAAQIELIKKWKAEGLGN